MLTITDSIAEGDSVMTIDADLQRLERRVKDLRVVALHRALQRALADFRAYYARPPIERDRQTNALLIGRISTCLSALPPDQQGSITDILRQLPDGLRERVEALILKAYDAALAEKAELDGWL
jgi:hypothetical protein